MHRINIVKVFALTALLFIMWTDVKAQDPTYSQFNLNQLYYNPAYTGYHYGYQISATYRTLWPNVRGKVFPGPLSTYHAWFDGFINIKNVFYAGIGAFAMQDQEGEGSLKTTSFGISYAQHLPKIGYKQDILPQLKISLGFKAYFNSIYVDWDKFVFTDQLNIDYGIIPGQHSQFNRTGTLTRNYFDFDAGILFQNNFKGQGKWYNEFGFSMAHVLAPSIALSGSTEDKARLPRKYVASYRGIVSLAHDKLFMGPTILFENQKKFFELNTGIDFFLKPHTSNAVVPLTMSVMNRMSIIQGKINTSAVIVALSHKGILGDRSKNRPVYYIGVAADFPYMGLGMQTAGAYEVTIGIIIPAKGGNGYSKCPYNTFDHSRSVNQYYKPRVKNR